MNRLGIAAATFILAVGIGSSRVGSLVQHVPPIAARLKNPFQGDEKAQLAGAKLYIRECASCHGLNL
jgi:mono/diheme cytochrome c family protein